MSLKMIPTLLTMANLSFGVLSLFYTMEMNYKLSAVMVLLCMVLDSMDGRIARKLDASSEFGKELDSLADLVSFGVAPALLIYAQNLTDYSWLGLIAAIWFAMAGALRLARFNIVDFKGYFVGVPITAAGSLMVLLSLISGIIPAFVFMIITVTLGILMVSQIKVPKY